MSFEDRQRIKQAVSIRARLLVPHRRALEMHLEDLMAKGHRDAELLADRVRARGFTVEFDNHVYKVFRDGTLVVQFAGGRGLSVSSLALARAEADLRRVGILPRDRHEEDPQRIRARRRQERMAAKGGRPKMAVEDLAALRNRIGKMIEERHMNIPQFAKMASQASDVRGWSQSAMEQSIRLMMSGQNITVENGERWERVLSTMNGQQPTAEPEAPQPEPTPDVPQITLSDESETLRALLEEAERERDEIAEKMQELRTINAKLNHDRRVMDERIKDLEERPFDRIKFVVDMLRLDEHGEWLLRRVLGD